MTMPSSLLVRPALLPHARRSTLMEFRRSLGTPSPIFLSTLHNSPAIASRPISSHDDDAVRRPSTSACRSVSFSPAALVVLGNRGNHRSFSSTAPNPDGSSSSFFTSPTSWWRGRQEAKEAEKYKQRIAYMASKDAWTIGDMQAELDEVVLSWKSKVPGLSDNKETKLAKKMHKAVSGIIEVVGKNATDAELDGMTRRQKLEAALKGETTVEEVNILAQQFQTMALMHRAVRKRKLEGKPIPSTVEGMQSLLQTDGSKLLSKAQKERMKESQLRMIRKSSRRR